MDFAAVDALVVLDCPMRLNLPVRLGAVKNDNIATVDLQPRLYGIVPKGLGDAVVQEMFTHSGQYSAS